MATVNYRLVKSKNTPINQIYVYISQGRGNVVLKKTGFNINIKDWSNTTKRPKQNNPELKNLFSNLNNLQKHIYDQINEAESAGVTINSKWLETVINNHFDRLDKKDTNNNLLTTQIQYIIDNANTRKIRGTSRIGLSENRVKGYNTFLSLIERYEKHLKSAIRLTDINEPFVNQFTNWLINKEEYSVNYSGKILDNLKTVCIDANKRGIKVNDYSHKIESFKESKEDKYIVTLSFDELEQIRTAKLTKAYLINVRKWLLIGCEIGQRGGDLLNLTKENIRYINNDLVIDITQQKTGKTVTIPIIKEHIETILKNELPHKISSQKFNDYLKELCEVCELDEVIKGKKYDKKKQRKILGYYPKHQLITSHSLRRSFATNYYKHIPTSILMEITAHSKESMFLEYIGKPKDKDENAKLFLNLVREMNKEKEPKLKAV
jgi:integrase